MVGRLTVQVKPPGSVAVVLVAEIIGVTVAVQDPSTVLAVELVGA